MGLMNKIKRFFNLIETDITVKDDNIETNSDKLDGKTLYVNDYLNNQPELKGDKSAGELWELIGQIYRMSNGKIERNVDYDTMSQDGVVGSALEMMADDASQPDDYTGKVAWIVSDDKNTENELNDFLHNVVQIDRRIWNWAYNIAKYGELYLRTFYTQTFMDKRKKLKKNVEERKLNEVKLNEVKLNESDLKLLNEYKYCERVCETFETRLKNYSVDLDQKAKNYYYPELNEKSTNSVISNIIAANTPLYNRSNLNDGMFKSSNSNIDYSDFYFEEVNPSNIFHLFLRGEPDGYVVIKDDSVLNTTSGVGQGSQDRVYPEGEFIHFMAERYWYREDIKIKVKKEKKENVDIKDDYELRKYSVMSGTSFIDKARMPYRIMKLLDDILLMTRLSRSSTFMVHYVEVKSASVNETMRILKEYKNTFKSNERFSPTEKLYTSTSSQIPMNDHIFIPTRDGKGVSSFSRIGGDVEFSNMVDVDYFRNKLFAAIKVPKGFLGFEEEVPGSIGNSSLVRLDIRYARTIKGIQKSLKYGIRKLVEYYLLVNNKIINANSFQIMMAPITSAEESDRANELQTRLQIADSLINVSNNFEDYVDKKKLVNFIFTDILRITEELLKSNEEIAAAQDVNSGEDSSSDVGDEDGDSNESETNDIEIEESPFDENEENSDLDNTSSEDKFKTNLNIKSSESGKGINIKSPNQGSSVSVNSGNGSSSVVVSNNKGKSQNVSVH